MPRSSSSKHLDIVPHVALSTPDEETALLSEYLHNAPQSEITGQEPEIDGADENNVKHIVGWNTKAGWIGRLRGCLFVVCIGILTFCIAINMSIITTTQSAIVEDFLCYEHAIWLTSSFMITMAITNPLTGRLSSIFGTRLTGLCFSTLLATGTLVVALSTDFIVFVVGRSIQGIGCGGMLTTTIILVLEFTSDKRRGFWIGLTNTGLTIGVSLGGVIGGLALASSMGWRGAFYFQVPLLLGAGLLLFFAIPSSSEGEDETSSIISQLATLDYAGILTLTPFLLSLLASLSLPNPPLYYLVPATIISLILFLFAESRTSPESAIIPFHILSSPSVLLSSFSTLSLMSSRWILLFYAPVYATVLLSLPPTSSGASLIPSSAGFAIGGIAVGLIMPSLHDFYIATLSTLLLFTVSFASFNPFVMTNKSEIIPLSILSFVNGLATGATLNFSLAHLLQGLPRSEISDSSSDDIPDEISIKEELESERVHARIATGVFTTFRLFAGSLGATIGGGVFLRTLAGELRNKGFSEEEIVRLIGSPVLAGGLDGKEGLLAREGYEVAMKRVIVVGVGLGVIALVTLAGTYRRNGRSI